MRLTLREVSLGLRRAPLLSVLSTLATRRAARAPRTLSPDSAWLATATPSLKNRGSIWPQLLYGSLGWSQTVESPSR